MTINPTAARVAAEVRAAMGRFRVSQATVAEALDMSQAAVSRRLRAEVPFDVAELAAIALLLDVPLSSLVPDAKANRRVTDAVAS